MSDTANTPRPIAPAEWAAPPQGQGWGMAGGFGPAQGEFDEPEFHISELVGMVWSNKWLVVAVLLCTVALGMTYAFTRPKLYRASVTIQTDMSTPRIIPGQISSSPSWWQREIYMRDLAFLVRSRKVATRVAERLGLAGGAYPDKESASEALLGAVGFSPIRDTNLFVISMTGRSPERVTEWANIYAETFLETNIEDNLERTRQVYNVISERLDPLREQVEESERRLVDFRTRQDALLFADQDKNVISEQVNTLTSEYARTKSERIRLETQLSALNRLREAGLEDAASSDVLTDRTIQDLREKRGQIKAELTDKLRTYKPEHPVIRDLGAALEGIETRLRDEVDALIASTRTDYEITRGREESLFNNIQQLRQESIELSRQTLELESLRRQYEQDKNFLEQMIARSKEVDLSANVALNNLSIIEAARVPAGPFSPNIPRLLAIALALGLALGVGSAFAVSYLDMTIRTPEELERRLGIEALTAVPRFKDDNARVLRESFQSLRTALLLAARGTGCQVVLVTSATPEEGKTTVSFNLAKVLAAGGERVLLIDGDLRRPRLHRLVGSKNVRGLTSVVLGEREIRDVITALAEVPHLDIVTSGPLPPNPPELFGKSSFKQMLDRARADYDWVIIDTPPVASVTDAVICSRVVDMALFVVQYGGAKRQLIQQALRNLARSGVRIPGAVINRVDVERSYYYYSAYYSSAYHYVGGEAPAKKTG